MFLSKPSIQKQLLIGLCFYLYLSSQVLLAENMSFSDLLYESTILNEPTPPRNTTYRTYGPVKKNEIIWNIAREVRPDESISIVQTIVALFQQNSNAFQHHNLNGLLTGARLNVPYKNQIQKISKSQADKIFSKHWQEWQKWQQLKISTNTNTSSSANTSPKPVSNSNTNANTNVGSFIPGIISKKPTEEAAINKAILANEMIMSRNKYILAENAALMTDIESILSHYEGKDEGDTKNIPGTPDLNPQSLNSPNLNTQSSTPEIKNEPVELPQTVDESNSHPIESSQTITESTNESVQLPKTIIENKKEPIALPQSIDEVELTTQTPAGVQGKAPDNLLPEQPENTPNLLQMTYSLWTNIRSIITNTDAKNQSSNYLVLDLLIVFTLIILTFYLLKIITRLFKKLIPLNSTQSSQDLFEELNYDEIESNNTENENDNKKIENNDLISSDLKNSDSQKIVSGSIEKAFQYDSLDTLPEKQSAENYISENLRIENQSSKSPRSDAFYQATRFEKLSRKILTKELDLIKKNENIELFIKEFENIVSKLEVPSHILNTDLNGMDNMKKLIQFKISIQIIHELSECIQASQLSHLSQIVFNFLEDIIDGKCKMSINVAQRLLLVVDFYNSYINLVKINQYYQISGSARKNIYP